MTATNGNRRPDGTGAADINAGDLEGSGKLYCSADTTSSLAGKIHRARRTAERIHHRKRKQNGTSDKSFRLPQARAREIEKLIRHRDGQVLIESDGDEYFVAISYSLQASGVADVLAALRGWCARWAPWALGSLYAPTLIEAAQAVRHRTHDLRADAVANLLRVTMREHIQLGLKTIGAGDVTREERTAIMRQRKLRLDRERQKVKRASAGRTPRAESASRQKPWKTAKMSRAKWYRLKKLGRETDMSKVENTQISDTIVSTASERVSKKAVVPGQRPEIPRKFAYLQFLNGPSRLGAQRRGAARSADRERSDLPSLHEGEEAKAKVMTPC